MVTDQQYREALEKISALEKKVAALSREFSEFRMKSGKTHAVERLTPPEIKRKDVTRYTFNGIQYQKRYLVLAVLKQFISDRDIRRSEDFFKVFPDHIQGSLGVIRKAEIAEAYAGAANRYFFEDENILSFSDGTFVISKDWSAKNIEHFINIAETLGYEIQPEYRNY